MITRKWKYIIAGITVSILAIIFLLIVQPISNQPSNDRLVQDSKTNMTSGSNVLEEVLSEGEKISQDHHKDDIVIIAEDSGISGNDLKDIKENADKIAILKDVMSFPIRFYGLVTDTEGEPISDAEISYSTFSKFFESSTTYKTFSDKQGKFSITNAKGGSLFVRVAKEGYYSIPESQKKFGYAVPSDFPAADDPNNPAILKLKKRGKAEPLIYYKGYLKLPRSGEPVGIDLTKREIVSEKKADIVVRAWSPEVKTNANNEPIRYSWKFEMITTEGGFIERTDPYHFIAPESGYRNSILYEIPEDMSGRGAWQHGAREEVFAKLPGGIYARIYFDYRPGAKNDGDTFNIESYTNPSGSRNLEYDPSLKVIPSQ